MISNSIRPDYNALRAAYDMIYHGSPEDKENALKFARMYGEVDDPDETPEEQYKRYVREAKLDALKREQKRRIYFEASRIARLREKLAIRAGDPAIKAEISEAQTKLFWLLHPM